MHSGSIGQDRAGFGGSEIESISWEPNGSRSVSDCGWLIFSIIGLMVEFKSDGGDSLMVIVGLPLVNLLAQCPTLPGRQLSCILLAFTQAQLLQ